MAAVYALYLVRGALPPFVIAAFLSYFLEPAVTFTQRVRGYSRSKAIAVVYLTLALTVLLFLLYFVPAFVDDVEGLAGQVPKLIESVRQVANGVTDIIRQYNLPQGLERGVVSLFTEIEAILDRLGDNLLPSIASSAGVLSYLVVAPVIAYYLLKDMNKLRQRAFVYLAKYPLPWVDLLRDVDRVLAGFVRGQTIVALTVGVLMWVGLTILGVRFSAALALMSGLGEFIPYFGPFVAAVPTLALALMKSPATAFGTLVLVGIVQWVDSNVVVPRVTGPRVGLHPLWMIFALLAGRQLMGTWGLFVAIPIAGIIGAFLKFGRAMYARS